MSSDAKGKVALAIIAARENIGLIRTWAGGRDLKFLKVDTLPSLDAALAVMLDAI